MIEWKAMVEKLISPERVRELKSQSLNKSLVATRTFVIKEIRRTYSIKATYLRERVFSVRKSSKHNLVGKIIIAGKRSASLAKAYPVRQTSLGVQAEIKRGKKFLIPHAFLAKGQAWRRAKQGNRFVPRYPLKLLRGPLEVVLATGVSRDALEYLVSYAIKEFERRLKYG